MTALPEAVRESVEEALEEATGRPAQVTGIRAVGGGCIHPSARLETASGDAFFVKWNAAAPADMFPAEADGLGALTVAAEGTPLRVPGVVGVGRAGSDGESWLLLEFLDRGRPGRDYGEALGGGLAELHRPDEGETGSYGWERDNYIGSLPQANPPSQDWADFWREARLAPQLALARERGHLRGEDGRTLDRLLDRLDDALAGASDDGPSLLHGDLWGGNVYPGPDGEPVLVDPAVHRGHREVDLAMSELFGGFPSGFLDAYREAWPLADGYRRVRRDVYQLYYLLVHVNLFGQSYVAGTLRAARKALGGL